MTTLLDHAIDAARRLPLDRQNNVAEALLALIEHEAQPRFDIQPPGGEPGEAEILPYAKSNAFSSQGNRVKKCVTKG